VGFTIRVAELIAFLQSKGYAMQTGQGRHSTKAVKDGHRIPIPMHGGVLGKGIACKILSEAGFKPEDLMEWRKQ
jgi:predicted RNA binding protein YcfA (HicA-like mRNA interferase family)